MGANKATNARALYSLVDSLFRPIEIGALSS